MEIGRRDLLWNYAATFFKIASSILLFPFILRMMSPETVGIWNIFITITSLIGLLDFGFNPSFSRNITYVFSGVRSLKAKGFTSVNGNLKGIDFGLLKGLIIAMRWFYFRVALLLFVLLITLGTFYIHTILISYNGTHSEIYLSWLILIVINTYNLYTLYYDSLLQGKGLVKKSKQIIIVGQSVYLFVAIILIMAKFNLVAIVAAQAISVIIIRILSYYSFFTRDLKLELKNAIQRSQKEILNAIYPNALKVGLTTCGSFMVQKSAIVIGSLYLTLEEIGSYGITIQLIGIITGLAGIYTSTYQPKISQLRVDHNTLKIKQLYLRGQFILILTYIAGGLGLIFLGPLVLNLIGSQTRIVPSFILLIALIISFLENNHSIAGGILLTNNEVPFYKASLIAGFVTVLLLIIFLNFNNMRLWAMVLAPGIAHLYNNWKWPHEVFLQLEISKNDIKNSLIGIKKSFENGR